MKKYIITIIILFTIIFLSIGGYFVYANIKNNESNSMENKKKRFINAICLITVGCLLFSTSTFAAQKNTSIKNPLKINIEESIKKQITDKDIEYVSKITNAMSKEKVNIVSRDVLSREDIVSSNESQLIVYRDGDLIGLEINPTVVNEIELEVVQDIVNSDTVGNGNYITIYDYHNAEKPNVEAFTEDVNQTNLNEKPEKKVSISISFKK